MDQKDDYNKANGTTFFLASLEKQTSRPIPSGSAPSTASGSEALFLFFDFNEKITSVPICAWSANLAFDYKRMRKKTGHA